MRWLLHTGILAELGLEVAWETEPNPAQQTVEDSGSIRGKTVAKPQAAARGLAQQPS